MLNSALNEALREFRIDAAPAVRSILLVDDELENLESLTALLDDQYEVHTATTAASALNQLATGLSVDLVVADQRMPGMSGVDLLKAIAVERPDTLRIILTAYDDIGPMMDAINSGAVFRFLLKPCAPEEMRSAIAEGLRIRRSGELLRHFIQASIDQQDALDRTVWKLTHARRYLLDAERLSTVGRAASGVLHNMRNLGAMISILLSEIRSSTHDNDAEVMALGHASMLGFLALVDLLENVRRLTHVDQSSLTLSSTPMESFLGQIAALVMLEDGGRCQLELEVDARFSRLVIDRARVRQAVTAILANAFRASQAGSKIILRVGPHRMTTNEPEDGAPEWVAIEVRDHGCGMDAETLGHATQPLFSRFVPPGLGFGLAAARLAARIHGGDLLLESTLGQGTQVSLILPTEPIPDGSFAHVR